MKSMPNASLRCKDKLNHILSDLTGQPLEKIEKDTDRDNFMDPEEAKEYGIIDEVITYRVDEKV